MLSYIQAASSGSHRTGKAEPRAVTDAHFTLPTSASVCELNSRRLRTAADRKFGNWSCSECRREFCRV